MYLRATDGLAEEPMLYGFFAEKPAASPFDPEIQEFLDRVRKRPQDFKKLLLTVTFHPAPILSQVAIAVGKSVPQFLLDVQLMHNLEPPGVFLDALRRIRDDFQKREAGFRRQIEAELQLQNEMIRTAGDSATRLLLQKKLQPILVEASLTNDLPILLCRLGSSSAQKLLPAALVQRIRNSEASEAHLTHLGRFLRRYAEVLQTKDVLFKAMVEGERKKRQQEEQEKESRAREEKEQKQRQQKRRRR